MKNKITLLIAFLFFSLSIAQKSSMLTKYANLDKLNTYEELGFVMTFDNGIFKLTTSKNPQQVLLNGKMVNISMNSSSVNFNVANKDGLAMIKFFTNYTLVKLNASKTLILFNSYEQAKNDYVE